LDDLLSVLNLLQAALDGPLTNLTIDTTCLS
jgi:hypothetical protein